ncbi:MAG: beta-lactamase family protein, partial [Phycisphaeraceae bacterium]|nr:beta-lactamase family protein [Phycisphaeraceae bacterium]
DQPQQSQTKFKDLQEFCELAADYPLEFDPGTGYVYGINQAILGRLVEVLSGRPFGAYLEEAIFEPLGMTDTSFVLDEERRARFQPLFVNIGDLKGYTNLLDELNYDPDSRAHFGGEGLVSDPDDYARFCEMLANGGELDGRRIITPESIETMTTVHSEDIFPELMPGMDMGFSVFVIADPERDGTNAPEGVFGWSGYHNTHFFVDPETRTYAVFMSRSRDFNFDIPRMLRAAVYGDPSSN